MNIPVEYFIASRRCGPTVAARIRRLNPLALPEMSLVRGYFRHPKSWRRAKRRAEAGLVTDEFYVRGGKFIWETFHRGEHFALACKRGRF